MRTELEKMLSGELYDPLDPDLVKRRARARELCQRLNQTRDADEDARREIPAAARAGVREARGDRR